MPTVVNDVGSPCGLAAYVWAPEYSGTPNKEAKGHRLHRVLHVSSLSPLLWDQEVAFLNCIVEKKKGSTQKGSDPAEGRRCLAIEMAGYRGFDLLVKLWQFGPV